MSTAMYIDWVSVCVGVVVGVVVVVVSVCGVGEGG